MLRGSTHEELKKVKNVVQYAIFAAYHLSLETSFLADEGATLPKTEAKSPRFTSAKMTSDKATAILTTDHRQEADVRPINYRSANLDLDIELQDSLSELGEIGCDDVSTTDELEYRVALSEACAENLALDVKLNESLGQADGQSGEASELEVTERCDDAEPSTGYYSTNDNHESILVSFSSHCILNGTVCERSRLLRVKFYGPSDKPLGRFLRDDLFDKVILSFFIVLVLFLSFANTSLLQFLSPVI